MDYATEGSMEHSIDPRAVAAVAQEQKSFGHSDDSHADEAAFLELLFSRLDRDGSGVITSQVNAQ